MNKQRRNRIAEALELISQARDILEEVKDEEQESYENLPESLQYGERGEQMQENVDSLEEFIGYYVTGRLRHTTFKNRLRQIQRSVPYYRYGKLWFSHGRRLPRRKPYTSYKGV